jgi:mRNA interferase MazF
MGVVADVRRFDVWLVNLDPAQGSEIKKARPCVIVSPDEMNRHIRTVIIAPMTSRRRDYPTRVDLTFQRKRGQVVLDQIRTVDKSRLTRRLGRLSEARARAVAGLLVEMFSSA